MSNLVTVSATEHRSADHSDVEPLLDRLQRARKSCKQAEIRSAEQALVIHFRSFAAGRARRFAGRGVDLDDLIQVANVGLVKAVRGWQPQPAGGFLQYAKPMVIGELKRYFRDQAPMVRLPRRLQEVGTAVAIARRDLARIGREPTDAEIAETAGLTARDVRADKAARDRSVGSLDMIPSADEPHCLDAERELEAAELRVMLSRAIVTLNDRERRLLALRYFDDRTQEQIGEVFGVSQMQVSRLLRSMLGKLQLQFAA